MQVEQLLWTKEKGWSAKPALTEANLVIYFGGYDVLSQKNCYQELKSFYPNAHILGCSTGGEILEAQVLDNSVVVAAMHFSKTTLEAVSMRVEHSEDSFKAGQLFAQKLNKPGLRNIFLLSDSIHINGSDLVRGLYSILDERVIVTGGLAADGAEFKHTIAGLDCEPESHMVAAIGFLGDALQVSYGCVGGWSPFGPERVITRSEGKTLYELDGKPALALYKQYLGEEAERLPGSGLFFPLSIRPTKDSQHAIVRTTMGINEKENAVIFADEVPTGYVAQLMRGEFALLVDGATKAASLAMREQPGQQLAILISCVGRKLLMGESISDETEAVADMFGHRIPTIGFYSHGEICHQQFTNICGLHNQTMTITVFHES